MPEERNAFVLDHQHGRREVTCKVAMVCNRMGWGRGGGGNGVVGNPQELNLLKCTWVGN